MHSWNYLLELNVSSGYMYIPVFTSRFPIVIEHVPDRTLPFPISRNTDFVFPSDISVPDPVLDQKMWLREWFGEFSNRSRPFSTLDLARF